jgi:hypothetical protein
MKDFWTWRKLGLFIGIIGLGIVGLVIADQQDFLNGRANTQTSIGDGIPDPLAADANILPIKTEASGSVQKSSSKKTIAPVIKKDSEIDGVKSPTTKSQDEIRFSGIIESYSTGCYADGECSITIAGKKVITTLGWNQEIVGTVKGIDSLDDLENKVNLRANVYAKKVEGGYTLYGKKDYYIEIRK